MKILPLLLLLTFVAPAFAHLNSPDVYFEGDAGPYHLYVTVRVPDVIPGVAQIEIRSTSAEVREIQLTALRITGPGADFAPKPDIAKQSKEDPQFFTGSLWLMLRGSWQVRIEADGSRGSGRLAVPIPAVAKRPLAMERSLGAVLFLLMIILAAGIVVIIGAAVREAKLAPEESPGTNQNRRGKIAMAVAAVIVVLIILLGNQWWAAEAAFNSSFAYKNPRVDAVIHSGNEAVFTLQNTNGSEWAEPLVLTDLIPDHDHLIHVFLVRVPQLDQFLHLHPEKRGTGIFGERLPSMPAGKYQIYADVVHHTGFPETFVGSIDIPEIPTGDFTGDDCGTSAVPFSKASFDRTTASLSDGGTIEWQHPQKAFTAREPIELRFLVKDKEGNPARDLQLYMGMQGHAQILSADRTVFAHIHPSGTVSMAAFMLAQSKLDPSHSMDMNSQSLPPEVAFLYGFPKPGPYRIFVQVKRGGRIESASFDTRVE